MKNNNSHQKKKIQDDNVKYEVWINELKSNLLWLQNSELHASL